MSTKVLKAVYDDALVHLMKQLEIYDAFCNGEIKCPFSGDTITWDNLHSLFPQNGAVKCCCSKTECQAALVELFQRKGS